MPGSNAPIYRGNSRFRVDVTDFDNNYICSLPYQNMQGEWKLGIDNENVRFEVPYKVNQWLTPEMLVPGKHMIFLYDKLLPSANPIRFAGPLWDVTASSGGGTLNCSASGLLSLYKKRLFRFTQTYTGKPEEAILNVLTVINAVYRMFGTGVLGSIITAGTKNLTALLMHSEDNVIVFDLLKDICEMGDGIDLFTKWTGFDSTASAVIQLYGGRIKPVAPVLFLEYGARPSKDNLPGLSSYSLTKTAQPIANSSYVISSTSLAGNAQDIAARAEYGQLYEESEQGTVGLNSQIDTDARATLNLKKAPKAVIIPQLVLKGLDPLIDFTYGDQVQVTIDDGWASYDGIVRVVGWQSTIGRHDQMTNVVYLNGLSEVS